MPMITNPSSLRHGLRTPFTMTIFLNESGIWRSELNSWRLLLLRGEVVGNLDIISLTRLIDDEIDFELLAQAFAAAVPAERFHDAYIDMIPANAQLVINDILHDMSRLLLTEIQPGVAQTEVGEVIFEIGTDILAPFDVIALRLLDQKSIRRKSMCCEMVLLV